MLIFVSYYKLRKMKKALLIILFSALCFSCSNDQDDDKIFVNVIEIGKGDLYGNGVEGINEQNLIITDENSWIQLMDQMNTSNNVTDDFSETDIDFSSFQIIAVFDEIKGNGGHSLNLNITRNFDTIFVNITDVVPQGNATTVITQPFIIVKIPNSTLPIVFQ